MDRMWLFVGTSIIAAGIFASSLSCSFGVTNIDPNSTGQKYGWSENGGWLNLQGNSINGVRVNPSYLEGLAWHENFGWINFGDGTPLSGQYSNLDAADFGVNRDAGTGNLSGYAWGENIGWIVFDTTASGGSRVTVIPATGRFTGYAWGENVGWLAFETVPVTSVAHTVSDSSVTDWTLY